MELDLSIFPFSRFGSYLTLKQVAPSDLRPVGSFIDFARPLVNREQGGGLYLNTVHGDSPRQEVFRLLLVNEGEPVPFNLSAGVGKVVMSASMGSGEICLTGSGGMLFHGEGVGLRLEMQTGVFDHAIPALENRWEVNAFSNRMRYMLIASQGSLQVDAPWDALGKRCTHIIADFIPDEVTGKCEAAVEEFSTSWHAHAFDKPFADFLREVEKDFDSFLEKTPDVPSEYQNIRQLAAYLNWSSVVHPLGHLKRPAMFMSKGIMSSLWSWDNCFNACALVYSQPELAWSQLMIPIDHQDIHGSFPDTVNDGTLVWNYCKPPVQGWALRRMIDRTKWINLNTLTEIYPKLCLWTDWWFEYRDDDHDGVPQYNHGNDSGWDNASVFDGGAPVESPDLCAFLIIQMDTLSEVAQRLGHMDQAENWRIRADQLLEKLLAHCWREDHFISPRSYDHKVAEGDSLINFVPIVLGERLPEKVRNCLVEGLRKPGRFITDNGLATESQTSPFYEPDGYWRGPIWAPPMMLIVEGLDLIGERQLAFELSKRFCDTIARSGFAENFDALSGMGLRDPAYTWTSSVFLILAHEYLNRKS